MRQGSTREAKWYVFLEKDEWFGANSAKINKKEKKRGGGGSEESYPVKPVQRVNLKIWGT